MDCTALEGRCVDPSAPFLLGLRIAASLAKWLNVVVLVGATLSQWLDVISNNSQSYEPITNTAATQWLASKQVGALPLKASTRDPLVRRLLDPHLFWMLLTPTATITHRDPTNSARLQCSSRHKKSPACWAGLALICCPDAAIATMPEMYRQSITGKTTFLLR
jgi:hypothetical protein